eukprot:CAMPEP_0181249034 /NCGR_PEP_ID=MMETSP1096-20121128/45521_1 /TAXON_ID=156174 ORGANISM="Chrysochromulina ericina, Strain CCMP281" /NCGR_SAMPLE_ID=MMETSP1096 /ASSEMBLY_ACC=CAM_ASM_000453 /LENGTH=147 /DNA_ID=CAMNT_0023346309 /DNA_START=12 /DNA_END=454 /DNA_ORIENTATION=-
MAVEVPPKVGCAQECMTCCCECKACLAVGDATAAMLLFRSYLCKQLDAVQGQEHLLLPHASRLAALRRRNTHHLHAPPVLCGVPKVRVLRDAALRGQAQEGARRSATGPKADQECEAQGKPADGAALSGTFNNELPQKPCCAVVVIA